MAPASAATMSAGGTTAPAALGPPLAQYRVIRPVVRQGPNLDRAYGFLLDKECLLDHWADAFLKKEARLSLSSLPPDEAVKIDADTRDAAAQCIPYIVDPRSPPYPV
ncbi:hypothetical protein C8Q80DRAFT_1267800 [Daedaleopsis nitida]|nr:hypothetical protein C8Q80DRAFT_1267800 [Daedaleopsis nitida]